MKRIISVEDKIRKSIETNKLNPQILGERNWYNLFIQVDELVWSRNLRDGYQIHVYSDKDKTRHLATVVV